MGLYEYTAYDASGSTVKGVVESDTDSRARQMVLDKGLIVTGVCLATQKKSSFSFSLAALSSQKNNERLARFTRQLSTLLGSGVPLAEAIDILIRQIPDVKMERSLRVLCEDIKGGSSFAVALEAQAASFSPLYINMVRAGESSGNLDVVLKRLADYLLLRQKLQSQVQAALTYPAFIAGVAGLMVLVVMFVLVPQVTTILLDMGRELPLLTRIILGLSNLLQDWWWALGAGVVALITGITHLLKKPHVRRFVDEKKYAVPLLGPLLAKAALSRFTLTFSTLLKSGIPALESLTIVSGAVANSFVAEQIGEAQKAVRDGRDLSSALEAQSFFPPLVTFMMAVGERSGELPSLLEEMGEGFNEELSVEMQKMVSILEPIIIMVMACVVVLIVLSILLPILEMTSSFG